MIGSGEDNLGSHSTLALRVRLDKSCSAQRPSILAHTTG